MSRTFRLALSTYPIRLPGPLRSTPVTALLRYYESSDSRLVSTPRGSPCFTSPNLHERPVSNHPMDPVPVIRLRSTVDSRQASPSTSRLANPSGRIEFLAYGPFARLRLLSTPPLSDAVSFDFDEDSARRSGLSPDRLSALASALAAEHRSADSGRTAERLRRDGHRTATGSGALHEAGGNQPRPIAVRWRGANQRCR